MSESKLARSELVRGYAAEIVAPRDKRHAKPASTVDIDAALATFTGTAAPAQEEDEDTAAAVFGPLVAGLTESEQAALGEALWAANPALEEDEDDVAADAENWWEGLDEDDDGAFNALDDYGTLDDSGAEEASNG